ncbi:Disease resistance protein L6 [Linum grandiflorum]
MQRLGRMPPWNRSSFPVVPALLLFAAAQAVHYLIKKRSETSGSSSPSTSSPYSTTATQNLPAADYEVFLSFRGSDVRTTFADYLYRFLDHSKIRTFFDDVELRKGEKLAPALVKAVEESKIFIPILSPDYASSKWCLQELALMVKCWKQGNGHIILPIFYMMDPRDVRHQEGSYKKAFQRHSKKHDTDTIKEWKEALKEVGEMKGWFVQDSDGQGAVVNKVFTEVWSHLTRNYMLVTDDLIGIDAHVTRVKELLQFSYEGVKIVGICGLGGIGKTAIVKALYNEICGQFDRYCFVEDVRETLLTTNGVVTLQKKIISDILRNDCRITDANEGINIIKNRICKLKVLIILDDADDKFKFEKVLGKLDDFCSGSRFIITTRDRRVMEFFQQYEVYEPEEMSEDHSLQLFSRHAFGVDHPPEEDVALSMEFVKAGVGLPLSLKVIGSLLFRRDRSFWKATLKQLKDILPSEVQETLRISYTALTHEEKQIFLDIACVFTGTEEQLSFEMWDSCRFHPEVVIVTLIQRSLIKLNRAYFSNNCWPFENPFSKDDFREVRNVFWMHDHVRDLGRSIVREEDHQHPWKRSRIWSSEDVLDMLNNGKGTDRLEVLRADMHPRTFKFTDRQFEELSGLRYLDVCYGEFDGSFESCLPNLRSLRLTSCISIPTDVNVKKLVVLHLDSCGEAEKLKSISLWGCTNLGKVPNLAGCDDLELLNFVMCMKMSGELRIDGLKNLKVLKLVGTPITELTCGGIGALRNLQQIYMDGTSLTELPDDIGSLPSLETLYMSSTDLHLKQLPALPSSLKRLYLKYLSSPCISNLSDLENLEKLRLDHYEHRFPVNIWTKLSKLTSLRLSDFRCGNLLMEEEEEEEEESYGLPSSLKKLQIRNSKNLERLPNLANLNNLTKLVLHDIGICEIRGLRGMRMLETLEIRAAWNLMHLDSVELLTHLKKLCVTDCCLLEKLPRLWNLTKLQELEISECRQLYTLRSSAHLRITGPLDDPELEQPEISGSMEPVLLLSNLGNLRTVYLSNIGGEALPNSSHGQFIDLSCLRNLREVSIHFCNRLAEVKGLESLEFLESLSIEHCTSLRKSVNVSGLRSLKKLTLIKCTLLSEVAGLEELVSLQKLKMHDCTSIKELPNVSCFEHLIELDISGCTELIRVGGIESLKKLVQLRIDDRLMISPLKGDAARIKRKIVRYQTPGCLGP